ncbi:MAG: hypothetical protein HY835_04705 [Anaerolineae bacterium]|nr:hypothetical protein [Anaerolineae bacterium]
MNTKPVYIVLGEKNHKLSVVNIAEPQYLRGIMPGKIPATNFEPFAGVRVHTTGSEQRQKDDHIRQPEERILAHPYGST